MFRDGHGSFQPWRHWIGPKSWRSEISVTLKDFGDQKGRSEGLYFGDPSDWAAMPFSRAQVLCVQSEFRPRSQASSSDPIVQSSNLCQVNPRPDNIFCVAERSKAPAELAELAGLKNERGTRRTHGTPDLHVAHMANVVAHVADVALTLQNRQLAASLCSGRCSDRWFWACWSSTQESCAHQRTPIHSYSCASLHIHLCALGFRAEAKTNSSASSTSFPPRCKLLSAPKRDKTIIDVASPKRETVQWVRWLQSFDPILSLRPCTANCNTCDVDLSARVERAVA